MKKACENCNHRHCVEKPRRHLVCQRTGQEVGWGDVWGKRCPSHSPSAPPVARLKAPETVLAPRPCPSPPQGPQEPVKAPEGFVAVLSASGLVHLHQMGHPKKGRACCGAFYKTVASRLDITCLPCRLKAQSVQE